MTKTKRIFYGWVIVGASVVILAIGLGMFNSTNSVFVKPICDALGFSRSQYTTHRTILTLISAFALPLYGKLIQRAGIKKILLVGAAALPVLIFCYSFANSLWHFYLLAFLNGIFFNALHFMVIGVLVSRWFEDKRGLATGIAYAGSGLGGAVMIPVVSRIVELSGWRFAFQFMGVLGLVILIPVILLLIKDSPESVGLRPYTSSKTVSAPSQGAAQAGGLTFQEALASGKFWLLAVGFFFIAVFAGATNTHSAPYLTDIGYPVAMVSAVVSTFMLAMTVGKIFLGFIYDRFGALVGNLLVAVCSIAFPIAALLAFLPGLPWVYAVSLGMASCGISVPVSILIIKYFDTKAYPALFSVFTMITSLGSAAAVPAMGAVYDYTGSYRPAWIAMLAFSVVITGCLVAVELKFRRERRQTPAEIIAYPVPENPGAEQLHSS